MADGFSDSDSGGARYSDPGSANYSDHDPHRSRRSAAQALILLNAKLEEKVKITDDEFLRMHKVRRGEDEMMERNRMERKAELERQEMELEFRRLALREQEVMNEKERLKLETAKLHVQTQYGPGPQRSSTERKPPKYDGTTPLKDFMLQFDVCRSHNKWQDNESSYQLLMCCTGAALAALSMNDATVEDSFQDLKNILSQELESKECPESYFLMLTRREQQPGETLNQLGQDIKRLVKLAYPQACKDERDRTAKEYFKKAIADSEVRKDVFRSRPKTLDEALSTALESESFYRMDSEKKRNRPITSGYSRVVQSEDSKPQAQCFYCAEAGHFKRDCPVWKRAQLNMRCYGCNGYGHVRRDCRNASGQSTGYYYGPPDGPPPSGQYGQDQYSVPPPELMSQSPSQPPPQMMSQHSQHSQQGNFRGPTNGVMGSPQESKWPNQTR